MGLPVSQPLVQLHSPDARRNEEKQSPHFWELGSINTSNTQELPRGSFGFRILALFPTILPSPSALGR
jgi:hypothetical protein